ncbi:MAG: efflux RND transporter periplasmic adaptor subunit [Candidatus Omnitrophota bacterium]
MRNKIIIALLIFAGAGAFLYFKTRPAKPGGEILKEIKPVMGSIQNTISTTGAVLPKNRLEIKPPVNGRIETILVKEGDKVKTGQTLAWMSSTERAALLDAARGQGEDALKYWQGVYKAIPLISPINGEVIVATTQPGQTVTSADAVLVLSDQLIIRAQVDETDIGKVKMGQNAIVNLDAYPDIKIKAVAEHIYYESETVNNVTLYKVDLLPEVVPQFFRSGMNAAVNFIENSKENTLLIPLEAVLKEKDGDYVLLKRPNENAAVKQRVELGISDDRNTEVLSGITRKDTLVLKTRKYAIPQNNIGTNPFMPSRGQRK